MDISAYLLFLLVISIVVFIKVYGGRSKKDTPHSRTLGEEIVSTPQSIVADAIPSTLRHRNKPSHNFHDTLNEERHTETAQTVTHEILQDKGKHDTESHEESAADELRDQDITTTAPSEDVGSVKKDTTEHKDFVGQGAGSLQEVSIDNAQNDGKNQQDDEDEDEDEEEDEEEDEDEDEDDDEDGNGKKDLREVFQSEVFDTVHAACASYQGKRPKNEDRVVLQSVSGVHFCGVFDGHDGSKASDYCAKYLVKNIVSQKDFTTLTQKAITAGFSRTDKRFLDKLEPGGSTAILAVMDQKKNLHIANVGDSRCVACVGGKAVALSTDHKPNLATEMYRVNKTSHEVQIITEIVQGQRVKIARIDGMLAVSRAMGDSDFKDNSDKPAEEQAVSAVPEITTVEITEEHEFVVLACDGLWDVLSNQEVVDFVKSRLSIDKSVTTLLEISKSLASYAIEEKHSTDNVTVLIMWL